MWCAVCAQLKIVALGNDVAEQPEPNAAMITTQLTVCFLFSVFLLRNSICCLSSIFPTTSPGLILSVSCNHKVFKNN